MNTQEILKMVIKELPEETQNNKSFKKIIKSFLLLITNLKNDNKILINESIVKKIKNENNKDLIISLPENDEILCNINYFDNETHYLLNIIKEEKDIIVELNYTKKEEYYEELDITVITTPSTSTWKLITTKRDASDYYYDYNIELYAYNKTSEPIKIPNIEEEKDDIFIKTFNTPKELTRKYRTNFKTYRKEINEYKTKLEMKTMDNTFTEDQILFTMPFTIDKLKSQITLELEELDEEELEMIEEELEMLDEYEELDEEIEYNENALNRLEEIQNNLIDYIGNNSEIVMSNNLIINLQMFITTKTGILDTTGIILKKEKNHFIKYMINIEKEQITLLKKTISKEEAQKLYKSDTNNKNVFGLDEFFNDTNTLKLTP